MWKWLWKSSAREVEYGLFCANVSGLKNEDMAFADATSVDCATASAAAKMRAISSSWSSSSSHSSSGRHCFSRSPTVYCMFKKSHHPNGSITFACSFILLISSSVICGFSLSSLAFPFSLSLVFRSPSFSPSSLSFFRCFVPLTFSSPAPSSSLCLCVFE